MLKTGAQVGLGGMRSSAPVVLVVIIAALAGLASAFQLLQSQPQPRGFQTQRARPRPTTVLMIAKLVGGEVPPPPPAPERVALPIPAGYNRVEIEYCTGCRWMLRAAWLAQELLTTFQSELDEVAIKPARVSGTFDVYINNKLVWSRKAAGRFPEAKEVKQKVRDEIDPDRDLGHSDVGGKKKEEEEEQKEA